MTAACAYARGFRLEGRIEGLQAGDTLRFERILLPSWKYGPGFDVVVRKPGAFRHRGKSEHDQYYLMTYRPKAGRAAAGDRGGKPVIVRPGDRIGMTGSTDAIYYCRLGGGIYDEPMLSSLLAVDDSLGRVRGRYLENAREASERNDTAASREWGGKFNRFYNGNPGVERKDMLLYHWGLCPGSIHIDRQVSDLFEKYKDKGLQVVGLTESIADIRSVYESLPAGKKTPSPGVDDMRPVLAGMLEHGWIEAELETGHPENRQIMETYAIEGWPFFVLIDPDGTILARNYTNAFYQAKKILDKELGGTAAE